MRWGIRSRSWSPRQKPRRSRYRQAIHRGVGFENLSGDSEQDYFSNGVVEDVITALSRFKSLFVIARNSSSPTKAGMST
jgi:TolB-like protein